MYSFSILTSILICPQNERRDGRNDSLTLVSFDDYSDGAGYRGRGELVRKWTNGANIVRTFRAGEDPARCE
jgi:hypothetical protein